MDRVKSGIKGFDELVGGGIPEQSVLLISGTAGTGKTILALQYLVNGAMKFKEKGVLITFEETDHKIEQQALEFGWDLEDLEKKGQMKIISIAKYSLGDTFTQLQKVLQEFKPKRLVIDSLTYIDLYAQGLTRLVDFESTPQEEEIHGTKLNQTPLEWNQLVIRKIILDLVRLLQKHNVTAIVTSELSQDSKWLSRDTFSEFICDGVVILKNVTLGKDIQRTLEVKKLRNTEIVGGIQSIDFTKKGIEIV